MHCAGRMLAPELEAALRLPKSDRTSVLASLCARRGGGALSLPLLSVETCAAMEREIVAAIATSSPSRHTSRMAIDAGTAQALPVTTRAARLLAESTLPHLAPLLGGKLASAQLCRRSKAYVLRYAGDGGLTFGERVYSVHTDDSDVTLNVAVGSSSGWRGSDLVYVDATDDRPGTPDVEVAATHRHKHSVGTAVIHGEGTYHFVEPLQEGERLSLVVLAMRDDAEWKRSYLADSN